MTDKEEKFTQVELQKRGSFQIAWIPFKFAVVGKTLKIQQESSGDWTDGWVVKQTYITRPWRVVEVGSRQWRSFRGVLDNKK